MSWPICSLSTTFSRLSSSRPSLTPSYVPSCPAVQGRQHARRVGARAVAPAGTSTHPRRWRPPGSACCTDGATSALAGTTVESSAVADRGGGTKAATTGAGGSAVTDLGLRPRRPGALGASSGGGVGSSGCSSDVSGACAAGQQDGATRAGCVCLPPPDDERGATCADRRWAMHHQRLLMMFTHRRGH